MNLFQNNAMRSKIDLNCSSPYLFASLQPIKKQSPTEGLGSASCGQIQIHHVGGVYVKLRIFAYSD